MADELGRRQLRLALSMNGGVSLAVWIGGAVCEIDRMRRRDADAEADPFWSTLLTASGYEPEAQVDVMAGASAGGLNAVMLAQAIRTNRPFDTFSVLWETDADIDALVKSPLGSMKTDNDPRAIFRGQYFLEQLTTALREPPGAPPPGPPPAQDLAIFVSATLVRPNEVVFGDAPGDPIRESRSDAYFHVAKRGSESRGLDGFAVDDSIDALASIGRATSSLPFLFEPVEFVRANFGSRLVNAFRADRPDVEIMDGGVVDNVPISRAIRAIYNSRASQPVRRVLLYLHPDPGAAPEPGKQLKDPATAIEVAQSFSGKRSETIREDIELLRDHNANVARRDAEADALLAQLLNGTTNADTRQAAALLAVDGAVAMIVRAATNPAGEMMWHAPQQPRVAPIVDVPGGAARLRLEDALRTEWTKSGGLLLAAGIRNDVATLDRLLYRVQRERPSLALGPVLSALDELRLLCDVVTARQLAAMLVAGEISQHDGPGRVERDAATALGRSRTELASTRVASPLDNATWAALAGWQPIPTPPADATVTLELELVGRLVALLGLIPDLAAADASPAERALSTLRAADPLARWAALGPITAAFMPLHVEPVASDQRIEFVRTAGDVHSPAADAFMALGPIDDYGQRIAGKQLHHLGAFFDTKWRTSDWRWGRLDSVGSLVEAALDSTAIATLRNDPSKVCAQLGVAALPTDDAELKSALVRCRQLQVLNELRRHDGELTKAASPDQPWDELVSGAWFIAWAKHDRRIASLLGTRNLTGVAIRGTITASKAIRKGKPLLWVLGTVLRPVLLAVAGLVLAGRWAVTALACTVCMLAAPRARTDAGEWTLWGIGLGMSLGAALLVELVFRPTRPWWRVVPPYALAIGGAVTGAWFIHRPSLFGGELPIIHWEWIWVEPALAAAVASVALFFWMRWFAAAALTAAVFAWYGWMAHTSAQAAAGLEVAHWPEWWPFHSMWTAWMIAILGVPILIGWMPDRLLRPKS